MLLSMPNPRRFIILLSRYLLNFFLLPYYYICLCSYLVLTCLSVILTCLTSYRIIVLHAVSLYCFTIDFLDGFQNSRQFQLKSKL